LEGNRTRQKGSALTPATKQMVQFFDELILEINHDLRHGDYRGAAEVVNEVPDDLIRSFAWYLAQHLHQQTKHQAHVRSLANLINVN
jgi:hypothetical protein